MGKVFDVDYARKKLNFLYDESSMETFNVASWLALDEFVCLVWDRVKQGDRISDDVLLEIIQPLYAKIYDNKKLYKGFAIRALRRGMRQLEQACQSKDG